MRFKKIWILLLVLLLIPSLAFSAKKKKKKRRGGKRIVEVNFDDELLIKGKLLGPSLFTLYQKKNVEFGKLIRPRKNFLPEMRATKGDIK